MTLIEDSVQSEVSFKFEDVLLYMYVLVVLTRTSRRQAKFVSDLKNKENGDQGCRQLCDKPYKVRLIWTARTLQAEVRVWAVLEFGAFLGVLLGFLVCQLFLARSRHFVQTR